MTCTLRAQATAFNEKPPGKTCAVQGCRETDSFKNRGGCDRYRSQP
ncbi:hypothetical protein CLOSYM_03324, partial [[Clostridium] symbiosum ATCC 14940]